MAGAGMFALDGTRGGREWLEDVLGWDISRQGGVDGGGSGPGVG